MYIKFIKGSEAEKAALILVKQQEDQHLKAVEIIEQFTGRKVNPHSVLSSQWAADYVSSWTPNYVYFDGAESVPGYVVKDSQKSLFEGNKRTKVFKTIQDLFSKMNFKISSDSLNQFGIYTTGEGWRKAGGSMAFYGWSIHQYNDETIVMYIHPSISELIDYKLAKDQFTVELERSYTSK